MRRLIWLCTSFGLLSCSSATVGNSNAGSNSGPVVNSSQDAGAVSDAGIIAPVGGGADAGSDAGVTGIFVPGLQYNGSLAIEKVTP